jgi:hypothetical protein
MMSHWALAPVAACGEAAKPGPRGGPPAYPGAPPQRLNKSAVSRVRVTKTDDPRTED